MRPDAHAAGTGWDGRTYQVVMHGSTVTATVDGLPEWSLEHADDDSARGTWQLLAALAEALAAAERAAFTDRLTGLPNRAGLEVELARRAGGRYALLLVDLDRFKPINDTYGHDTGDAVLAAVGGRLAALTPLGGFAARLGGDEFVLSAAAGQALDLAYAVHRVIADPMVVADGPTVSVGASVGVAYAQPGLSVHEVLHRADMAMYQAKAGTPSVVVDATTGTGAGGPVSRSSLRHREMHNLLADVGAEVGQVMTR